jgi:hypothetical protein
MKQVWLIVLRRCRGLIAALLILLPLFSAGQQNILINMAPIDGLPLTPANVFNYHVQSSGQVKVDVKGAIRYRNSNMSITYTFSYSLKQGINVIHPDDIHPQWQFSSSALQELFTSYKILPEGTYEYCVTVTPANVPKESTTGLFTECLYHRSQDIFLINLIYPENKAKLIEYNPMLSWIANYSFSSELTYRIRVAEIKQGQNPVNAVMRNQPVYEESNLMQNSVVYPVYARPLVANQPYAWTVDAYYKGILLGGAETWQFIIPDTLTATPKFTRSYIDIGREHGENHLYAVGTLKIKYVLEDHLTDILSLELFNEQKETCKLSENVLNAKYGDNRYDMNLAITSNLKHRGNYTLVIKTKTNHTYTLPFQYFNPDFSR